MIDQKQSIIQFLYDVYNQELLRTNMHLDGGAALSLFYNIDRTFSNDVDFTIEDQVTLNALLAWLGTDFTYFTEITHRKNAIIFSQGRHEIFKLDYYIVPSTYCEYSSQLLRTDRGNVSCMIHSLDDIFVEKLFCLFDRKTYRDVHDLIKIGSKPHQSRHIATLYERKNVIKQSPFNNLDALIYGFVEVESAQFLEQDIVGKALLDELTDLLRALLRIQI